jgi:hypothetical protein
MSTYRVTKRGDLRRRVINNSPPLQNSNKNEIGKEEKMNEDLFYPIKNSRERKIIERKERLTGKDDIVISFISDPVGSNFYSEKFRTLLDKVDQLGLDYIFCKYESDRNYYQNCCYKPYFIKTLIKETGKNVIWVDGDTILKNGFSSLNRKDKEFDMGLVSYTGSMDSFVASPVYFKNTEVSNTIIDHWENHCTSRIENGECELDHDALKHSILPHYRDRVRINLCGIELHKGENVENVNSDVPYKRDILIKMRSVNMNRTFPGNVTNYNIV